MYDCFTQSFSLFFLLPLSFGNFLPTSCRCRGSLLHLITPGDTHSVGLPCTRNRPVAEAFLHNLGFRNGAAQVIIFCRNTKKTSDFYFLHPCGSRCVHTASLCHSSVFSGLNLAFCFRGLNVSHLRNNFDFVYVLRSRGPRIGDQLLQSA